MRTGYPNGKPRPRGARVPDRRAARGVSLAGAARRVIGLATGVAVICVARLRIRPGAGSAETAYELLVTEQAKALLLDIHLPTMSGLALYLAIIHRWPALEGCIAIMTGDADAEEVRTWLERHRCPVIRKPFNLKQISDWLAAVIALQEERRERGGAQA